MSGLATSPDLAAPALDSEASAIAPSRPRPDLVVCDGCDAVYSRQPLEGGEDSRCTRCETLIGRGHRLGPDGQLALALAAFVVFVMGNVSPIVTLDLRGVHVPVTLFESVATTWRTGQRAVAVLAFATAFLFPLGVMSLRIYVLGPLMFGRMPPAFPLAMRLLRTVTRWSMVEVFMLGTLVAVVRSAGLADVIPGVGIFSFAVLTVLLTANQSAGLHRIWQRSTEVAG